MKRIFRAHSSQVRVTSPKVTQFHANQSLYLATFWQGSQSSLTLAKKKKKLHKYQLSTNFISEQKKEQKKKNPNENQIYWTTPPPPFPAPQNCCLALVWFLDFRNQLPVTKCNVGTLKSVSLWPSKIHRNPTNGTNHSISKVKVMPV